MCCLQYFAGEALSILGVRGAYSLRTSFISDLGAVGCSADLCSRWHALMNASFLLRGCLIAGGALLTRSSFPRGWLWTSAINLIGASGSASSSWARARGRPAWPALPYAFDGGPPSADA